ncbi:MAG: carbohydrate binding family 9 domain-containing protein [Acidobacteria bacterium]|nr:carbohydrate binding family 9 domain-containing protein [Acidobacteriota bacterium]
MPLKGRLSLIVILAFGPVASVLAAARADLTIPAGRLSAGTPAPTIDGRVTEDAWSKIEPQSSFTQQDPIEGAPASERTEVRVLFDQGQMYIGVICFDREPGKIIVSQARRDSQLGDVDSVVIVLDTFNDNLNAFVFGTNALGIQYDGQVSGEGQSGGASNIGPGVGGGQGGGQQRGTISAFNPNWDGDWRVKAQITERGWEAEMAIPLKTLRYASGDNRTWGINVMRNIRRKNEQVYLSPIPRGFDIYRVSLAAKLTGLELPARRDVKLIPFVLGSANKDYTAATRQLDRKGDVGLDVKWGLRPSLTADFTVNTDFAQVEADEEQVNLTRFDLFFPEKRPFFLENASTFQFGAPQQIDVFFSRRIGLSATGSTGTPIGIIGGARLSGKVRHFNIGLLDMQTEETIDARTDRLVAPGNNFSVFRLQRELGRSTFGGIIVNRQGTGSAAGRDNYNRAYGLDANVQVSTNAKLFTFIARSDSPGAKGSDYAARVYYNFSNNVWLIGGGYSQVGDRFDSELGYVPRRGYRRPEYRVFFQPQPKRWSWIRRVSPHTSYSAYIGLDGELQSSNGHFHFFEIQPKQGGRFGTFVDRGQDRPVANFVVFNANGTRVVIPPGLYTWYQLANEFLSDPSARFSGTIRVRTGGFYDGDYTSVELNGNVRVGSRFIGSAGWTRQNVDLKYGKFHTDLVPVRVSYSFTTLASLQALMQYNNQSSLLSSNIRLALLNRSGTGLFVVYNDRRDTTTLDPREVLGRSFVVKYTRLLDF